MKVLKIFFCIILTLLCLTSSSFSSDNHNVINGKVIAVTDGDTIKVLDTEKIIHKLRFAEIDAPEKSQPYGQKSKQYLSDLIFNKDVNIRKSGTDRYKRVIGYVYLDDININLKMVKNGMAWVYTRYSKDVKFREAEDIAREQNIGLWSLQKDQITPPWKWRRK